MDYKNSFQFHLLTTTYKKLHVRFVSDLFVISKIFFITSLVPTTFIPILLILNHYPKTLNDFYWRPQCREITMSRDHRRPHHHPHLHNGVQSLPKEILHCSQNSQKKSTTVEVFTTQTWRSTTKFSDMEVIATGCDCEFTGLYFLFEIGSKNLKPSIKSSEATKLIATQNLHMTDTPLNASVWISNLTSKVSGKQFMICKGNKY